MAVAVDEDPPNGDAAAAAAVPEEPPPPKAKTLPDVELAAVGAAAAGAAPKVKELEAAGLAVEAPKENVLLAVVVAAAAELALEPALVPNENIPAAGCCDPA